MMQNNAWSDCMCGRDCAVCHVAKMVGPPSVWHAVSQLNSGYIMVPAKPKRSRNTTKSGAMHISPLVMFICLITTT